METNFSLLKTRRQRYLPHWGSVTFESLKSALTGSRRPARRIILRAAANGIDKDQFESLWRRAGSTTELGDLCLGVSQHFLSQATYWYDLGLQPRARDNHLASSLWGIYAEVLCPDISQKRSVRRQLIESYRLAAPHLNYPAEFVEIACLSDQVSGYLRFPLNITAHNLPCAIFFNSLGSPKEELHYAENSLLAQGIATLSVDYPTDFLSVDESLGGFDLAEFANSIFLFVSSRPELDPSRLAFIGLSVGGRLALHLASMNPERVKAIVTLSAPLNNANDLEAFASQYSTETMMPAVSLHAALYELFGQTPLEYSLDKIQAPTLLIAGGKDNVVPSDTTQLCFERLGTNDKKVLVCPQASHNLYEQMPSLRYEVAQWLKPRL